MVVDNWSFGPRLSGASYESTTLVAAHHYGLSTRMVLRTLLSSKKLLRTLLGGHDHAGQGSLSSANKWAKALGQWRWFPTGMGESMWNSPCTDFDFHPGFNQTKHLVVPTLRLL